MEQFPYGRTLKDVEEMANCAVLFTGSSPLTIEDQREVARDAIVDMLYSEREGLDPDKLNGYLVRVGQGAVRDAHRAAIRENGVGEGAAAYWYGSRGHVTDFTDSLVERLAVRYAWDQLSPEDQDTLALHVEHGTNRAAAKAAGVGYGTYWKQLRRARQEFCKYLDVPVPKRKIARRTTAAGGSVFYRRNRDKWEAQLGRRYIGVFDTEQDARFALDLVLANAA